MSQRDELHKQIHDYVVGNFMFDASDVDDGASLSAAGVLDSMGVLEMVLFVEESLGVTIRDDEVLPEYFDSVNALTDFVLARMVAA